jgi:hypothetical protein
LEALVLGGVVVLALLVATPFLVGWGRRLAHHQRQRLVDAPRKIGITGEPAPRSCRDGHQRSASRARPDGHNGFYSVCRKCGVRMHRTSDGEWTVVEEEPAPGES